MALVGVLRPRVKSFRHCAKPFSVTANRSSSILRAFLYRDSMSRSVRFPTGPATKRRGLKERSYDKSRTMTPTHGGLKEVRDNLHCILSIDHSARLARRPKRWILEGQNFIDSSVLHGMSISQRKRMWRVDTFCHPLLLPNSAPQCWQLSSS